MKAKKSAKEKQANAEYMKKYRDPVKIALDRMLVCAFISFFNEQVKEFHRTPEYSLAFALVVTNDDVLKKALEERPRLVKRWLEGDFDKANKKERDARLFFLQHTDEPKRRRVAI